MVIRSHTSPLYITGPQCGEAPALSASPHIRPVILKYLLPKLIKIINQPFWCWGMEKSVQSRLIPWLLMPWLLGLPGHQQPWYWICRINGSLSSMRKDFNYLCHISIVKLQKMELYFLFPKQNMSTKWHPSWLSRNELTSEIRCFHTCKRSISHCSAGCISVVSLLRYCSLVACCQYILTV